MATKGLAQCQQTHTFTLCGADSQLPWGVCSVTNIYASATPSLTGCHLLLRLAIGIGICQKG